MPLTYKEHHYRYSMIKGRVAETLIQELFLSLGYDVFHYGMESSVPGIAELLRTNSSPVAKEIRSMPDFIMRNQKTNEVFFIGVKHRGSGSFSIAELDDDYPWPNAIFIIVSKRHIKCVSYQEMEEGKCITPTSQNYLHKRKEFELDKETIISFCKMAVKFFEGV